MLMLPITARSYHSKDRLGGARAEVAPASRALGEYCPAMNSLGSLLRPRARVVWRLALTAALILLAVLALSGATTHSRAGRRRCSELWRWHLVS